MIDRPFEKIVFHDYKGRCLEAVLKNEDMPIDVIKVGPFLSRSMKEISDTVNSSAECLEPFGRSDASRPSFFRNVSSHIKKFRAECLNL